MFARIVSSLLIACVFLSARAEESVLTSFKKEIEPILDQYCYDCHGYGSSKGGVTLDGFESEAALLDHGLWLRALKNVRSGIMPPKDKDQLQPEEKEAILRWIREKAFALNTAAPDPGRVTVRRLNRVEYRNTVRDLLGVDYDTQNEFPADDSGHGFDNIADVLTISPMLMEKYIDAAQAVVAAAVPTQPRVVAERMITGNKLRSRLPEAGLDQQPSAPIGAAGVAGAESAAGGPMKTALKPQKGTVHNTSLDLLYYFPARVGHTFDVAHAGKYQVVVDLRSIEKYVDNLFDYNKCLLIIRDGDEVLLEQEFVREGNRSYEFKFDRDWSAGEHAVTFEIKPLTFDVAQHRLLRIRLNRLTLRGPMSEEHWVKPARYAEFFPGEVPRDRAHQAQYARTVLERFAGRAFRRPAPVEVVDRLVELALQVSAQPGITFEAGVAQAMVAVLSSPRFLFREAGLEPLRAGEVYPRIDEYSLATRLSYFLWSSTPDEELLRLAAEGRLRDNLKQQVSRLLNDGRSKEFIRNFTGQWLQARDIATVPIDALNVFLRENPNPELEKARATFRRLVQIDESKRTPEQNAEFAEARKTFLAFVRQPRPQLTEELREAMRMETEMLFEYVLREERSMLELINADYAHLNEDLAKHYGIPGVAGREMRKVQLPPDSPRGGVLTQGTVLTVTSNPTRTSPVKRGVFILDNILGTPPAPPPPNIPSLEDAASEEELKKLSLRETLALHAKNSMCSSCHSRMDPLGLALENFNAMGGWREKEQNAAIDPSGELITGEKFKDVRELKHVLVTDHRHDFYHCMTEKLMIYALGRGLEYYDVTTLDQIVHRLEQDGGKLTTLITSIIDSAPFQRSRPPEAAVAHRNLDTQLAPARLAKTGE
jgi:hypothetical protein